MQNNLKDLIKEIESKAKIEEIISNSIHLERKGNNYIGLCPFHTDSNPSMSVSPAKGIFKCFSCGAGGNVITFEQNFKGISFIDAVKEISNTLDIDWRKHLSERQVTIDHELKAIWEVNKEALNFFKYSLSTSEKAMAYVKNRELTEDAISEFEIAWSDNDSNLINYLVKKGFEESIIVKSGLAKLDDDKVKTYFINRLMFPINDKNGNIIGFSGRIIKDSKYSKYLNTPETKAFKKGEILYNYHRAKSPASLKKEAILVEGFMDVIAYYKIGLKNVFATMGTAFTNKHALELKKVTNNIILSFDKDISGINVLIKTGKELISAGVKVKVSFPKVGKDVDEYLKISSPEEVLTNFDNAENFLKFYVDQLFKSASIEAPDFEKIREVLKVINLADDEVQLSFYINKIATHFGVDKDILIKQSDLLNKQQTKLNQASKRRNQNADSDYVEQMYKSANLTEDIKKASNYIADPYERILSDELDLLSCALNSPDAHEAITQSYFMFSNKHTKDLDKWIKKHTEETGSFSYDEFINTIDDADIKDAFEELKAKLKESSLNACLQLINNLNEKRKLIDKKILMEDFRNEDDPEKRKFIQKTMKDKD